MKTSFCSNDMRICFSDLPGPCAGLSAAHSNGQLYVLKIFLSLGETSNKNANTWQKYNSCKCQVRKLFLGPPLTGSIELQHTAFIFTFLLKSKKHIILESHSVRMQGFQQNHHWNFDSTSKILCIQGFLQESLGCYYILWAASQLYYKYWVYALSFLWKRTQFFSSRSLPSKFAFHFQNSTHSSISLKTKDARIKVPVIILWPAFPSFVSVNILVLCYGCSLETGKWQDSPTSCDKQPRFIMDASFYRVFKIPTLEQLIGQSLSTAQLTNQSDVFIQDWMGLAGVPCLSSNATYPFSPRDLLTYFL